MQTAPIHDQGFVLLTSPAYGQNLELFQAIYKEGSGVQLKQEVVVVPYTDKEQLLDWLVRLETQLIQMPAQQFLFAVQNQAEPDLLHPPHLPFGVFKARIENYDIIKLIHQERFTSHMQPIIDLQQGTIYGYEFVLRPDSQGPDFRPYELFQAARSSGLHSFLDRQARISGIRTSAQFLPKGMKRFINFLPSSIYNPAYCLTHTFAAIKQYDLDPADFVFEVVETEKIVDIAHLQHIFKAYKDHGVQVALDDVGSGFSTVEVLSALKPDFVKIDRGLIDHCDQDPAKQEAICHIRDISHSIGAKVLAEGMERAEELSLCRELGLTYAQGYFIGKPAASPIDSSLKFA